MSNSEASEAGTERLTRSTARNPRRRQRQSENDTLKTSAPQRKRSKLSEDTFQPRASTEKVPTTDALQAAGSVGLPENGHYDHQLQQHVTVNGRHASTQSIDMDMPVRGKKMASKRAMRGDGATVLTQNKCYNVRMLPSTPNELRKEGVEYRGSIDATGHALAVTHDRATIWEYTAHTAGNTRVFDLPFPSRPSEPLPFGALVASGVSNTDMGLVVISATSGKVFFYESIDRAASLGLFQDRKSSVEGDIGLYSGEKVADVVLADHAGLLVVLDSGRIAQLTLRDAQGKARVSVNFLRVAESHSGGIFGSIKGYLASGFKKDLAALHTRPSKTRGQMQAVALTEGGEVLTWELDWLGRSEYKSTVEIKDKLVEELKLLAIPELEGRLNNLIALDFALMEKPTTADGLELATLNEIEHQPLHIVVLLRVGGADMHDYAVAAVTLTGTDADVHQITYITKYHTKGGNIPTARPRLVVPKPEHTIFITFEDATVMVPTRLPPSEGPEAQLITADVPKEAYEESLYLRPGKGLAIRSSFAENVKGSSHASCIAFVKSGGLVRISSADVHSIPEGPSISAKSRMENAVFHGILSDNILDFSRTIDGQYSIDDLENAALQISDEILRAATPYTTFISPTPTSMEQHLVYKARALKALAQHVRTSYPTIPRATMWRLLSDAEHVAAGQDLWTAFEEHVADSYVNKKRKATLLDEVCTWFVHDPFVERSDLANEDPVRKFFIGGLHHLEILLNNVRICMTGLKKDTKPPKDVLRIAIQANDLWIRSVGTAFTFRARNASEYGILPELLEDGVLTETSEYIDLPEFWTSQPRLVDNTVAIARLSRYFANVYYESGAHDASVEQKSSELAQYNPDILQLYCQQSEEAINWRASRPSQKDQEYAEALRARHDTVRYSQLRSLAAIGQAEAGMRLAEKYNDMNTLTDLVLAEDQYLVESADKAPTAEDRQLVLNARMALQAKLLTYFDRFGEAWANPFFDKMFSDGSIGFKLDQAQKTWKSALAKYLRADSRRGKLCWINDVMESSDFKHAGNVLAETAHEQESKLWAKKVELSMSKLALMAAEEDSAFKRIANGGAVQISNPPTDELSIVHAQERLYDHIHNTIIASLDREAETHNCMIRFGTHIADMTALRQLLENGLNMIIDHTVLSIEQLVDVLTLIDISPDSSDDGNIGGGEFVLALSALNAAAPTMTRDRFETLLQLIWKRCYIYDDWTQLKVSSKQSDAARLDILRGTVLWYTIRRALDDDIFNSESSEIRVLAPSDCLGTACRPEDFSYRFPDEELLLPILHDCQIQDEILQSFVADRRLDEIAVECLRDAQAVKDAQDAANAHAVTEYQGVDVEAEITNATLLENGNGHYAETNGYGDANGYADGEYAGAGGDSEMF